MEGLQAGQKFWSIYVDHYGRKSNCDFTELTEPWSGEIVVEDRLGGEFVVLATGKELYDAKYVIISHVNCIPSILFDTFQEALEKWEHQELMEQIEKIDDAQRRIIQIKWKKENLIKRYQP